MKILLFTWFCYGEVNLGQTLQAYALESYLQAQGHTVKLVTYDPCYKRTIFKRKFFLKKVQSRENKYKRERQRVFSRFILENMNITRHCSIKTDINTVIKRFKPDLLMAGSDQIWNPTIFDDVYWLNFNNTIRKVAFAPSFTSPNEIQRHFDKFEKINKYLQEFDAVSSREEVGCQLLSSISSKDVQWVLDPCFLISKSQWSSIGNLNINYQKYLLVYCFTTNDISNIINQLMQRYNLDNVIIIEDTMLPNKKKEYIYLSNVGPVEFIKLIENAEVILTESFHGTVFSLIFNKEFFSLTCYLNRDAYCFPERITEMLESLQCNRLISSSNMSLEDEISSLDYQVINNLIEKRKRESIEFLLKAIERI